jgi:alkanesulfonate monooxygenase SsuD/methylene tetrahydromethanopterin reductase-like flavin-dependent oxidoreductase (luciferase family)
MRHAAIESKPVAAMREAAEIVRGVLAGDAVDIDGKVFSAHVPALKDDGRHAALGRAALFRRAPAR